MIARAGSGWQTALADLSLILFLATAAALAQAGDGTAQAVAIAPSDQSEPTALYRAGEGAPPLGDWLSEQPPDPRQQLTIVAQYEVGGQAAVLAKAGALAREAEQKGIAARIVVEPGTGGTVASLAYDVPPARLARALQNGGHLID